MLLFALIVALAAAPRPVSEGARSPAAQQGTEERSSQERLQSLLGDVLELVNAGTPMQEGPLLEALERLRSFARPLTETSGAIMSYGDYEVAFALLRARRPERALEVLQGSLEWRAAGVGTAPWDWYLFIETAKRRELLTELARESGAWVRSFESLAALESLLDQAEAGAFHQRAEPPARVEQELSRRRFIALQLRADIELISGLPDLAARTIARLEDLLEERWGEGLLRGPEASNAAQMDQFQVRRLRLRLSLALGRPHQVGPSLERWRAAGELRHLSAEQQHQLTLLEASARFEQERAGLLPFGDPSPFEALLKAEALAELSALDRARVQLMETARLVELGELRAAADRLAGFRAEATAAELGNFHVQRLSFGVELRSMTVALEQGAAPNPAALDAVRERFTTLLDPLTGGATRDRGTTFLKYGAGTEILSELIELELGAAPGLEGRARGLEHALALQEVGGLAGRLGLAARGSGRVAALQALLDDAAGAGLIYVPGRHRSRAFLIAPDSIASYPLAGVNTIERARAALEQELTTFVALGTTAQRERLSGRVTELSELLLPPDLKADLRAGNSVALIGPGSLGYVPFELLELDPDRPLGTELALDYWPSARVAEHLTASAVDGNPALDLGLLARTQVADDARGFELTARELSPLLAGIQRSRQGLALDSEATQSWLVGDGADARAWILLAHGERPAGDRDSSALLIPGPGGEALLHSESEFWNTPGLRVPELVWLGACSAWEGPFRRGDDGATHLPSRFLQHGARAVVLPFVELRYDDLVALVSATHAELLRGAGELSLAEALRRARVEAIQSAEDELGRIAPLLVHQLGGSRPAPRFASGSSAGGRVGWGAGLLGLAAACGGAGLLLRRRRPKPASSAV